MLQSSSPCWRHALDTLKLACSHASPNRRLDLIALALNAGDGTPVLSSPRASALLRLKMVIDTRLSDPSLKPAEAAAAAGISVRYANELLAQDNYSLERYILRRRLERCRRALEDPMQVHRMIGEIAFGWGFSDHSHFTRRFRAEFGMTPGDCRKVQQGRGVAVVAAICRAWQALGRFSYASVMLRKALGNTAMSNVSRSPERTHHAHPCRRGRSETAAYLMRARRGGTRCREGRGRTRRALAPWTSLRHSRRRSHAAGPRWPVARRALRAVGNKVPVMFLTSLGGVDDRVDGLDVGGDDYLVKPFAFSELMARVNALARRPHLKDAETVLRVGDLEMDLIARKVTRGGDRIDLQPREFRLLEVLMRNKGRVLTRTMLLERVWGFHFEPRTSVVETHISRLRTKIDRPYAKELIQPCAARATPCT